MNYDQSNQPHYTYEEDYSCQEKPKPLEMLSKLYLELSQVVPEDIKTQRELRLEYQIEGNGHLSLKTKEDLNRQIKSLKEEKRVAILAALRVQPLEKRVKELQGVVDELTLGLTDACHMLEQLSRHQTYSDQGPTLDKISELIDTAEKGNEI